MKSCSTHRKHITWLALDALDGQETRTLRAHLESCEGCRRYLEEISNVTERLVAMEAEPDILPSESFHQRLVGRLQTQEAGSFLDRMGQRLQTVLLNWRVVLPVIGTTAVGIAALCVFQPRPAVPSPARTGAEVALTPAARSPLDPTISNYQMVANRSLEELDDLLTRQGNRNPPPLPLYTASTFARANVSD